jgi:hypothetical protein
VNKLFFFWFIDANQEGNNFNLSNNKNLDSSYSCSLIKLLLTEREEDPGTSFFQKIY